MVSGLYESSWFVRLGDAERLAADIVLFDANLVADRATFAEPQKAAAAASAPASATK